MRSLRRDIHIALQAVLMPIRERFRRLISVRLSNSEYLRLVEAAKVQNLEVSHIVRTAISQLLGNVPYLEELSRAARLNRKRAR